MPLFEPARVKNLGVFARIDVAFPNIGTCTVPEANGLKAHPLIAFSAVFVASILGTTMTVTSVTSGIIYVGQAVTGGGTTAGTIIKRQLTGTTYGVGTYEISISQTRASGTKNSSISAAPTNYNLFNFAGAITENFQTTSYYAAQDCNPSGNGLVLPQILNNKFIEVTYGVELLTPIDAMIVPLLHNGYTPPSIDSFIYANGNGAPMLINDFGYGGSFESNGNNWHWVTHNFIYKGFIENMGSIGLYRNIHTTGNAASITASIRKYFIQIRQINL